MASSSLATLISYAGTVVAGSMCFAIGSNDVCQSLAVGSGGVSVSSALAMGAVAEFLGVVTMGAGVAATVKEGFLDLSAFSSTPLLLSLGMFATLAAAATWLLASTYFSLPVSTTHSVVGGLIGFGLVTAGPSSLRTEFFSSVFASWILSPTAGCAASYAALSLVNASIFAHGKGASRRASALLPYINGITASIMALFMAAKGLPNVGIVLPLPHQAAAAAGVGALVVAASFLGILPAGRGRRKPVPGRNGMIPLDGSGYGEAEDAFTPLVVATAVLVAFAHGSNDVSNGVGCLLVMREVAEYGRVLGVGEDAAPIPQWIMFMGGICISSGLLFLGARVMATMGSKITKLTPSRGFCAQLATASTVLAATATGMPVSSTHTMVGAVTGLALASTGPDAKINYATIKKIVVSWVVTLPIGAVTAVLYFWILSFLFYSGEQGTTTTSA